MGKDLKGKELGIGLSQRPDGRYRARYKGVDRYAKTLKDARQVYKELVEQLDLNLSVNKQNMTFSKYFSEWLNFRIVRNELKDSSVWDYKAAIVHVMPFFENVKLKNITKTQVKEMQVELLKTRKASSVNDIVRKFSTVLQSAVDDDVLLKNPARIKPCLNKAETKQAVQTIHRALNENELELFFSQYQADYGWYFNAILLLANTGLRIGELRALQWSDVDYEGGFIHVRHNFSVDRNGKPVISTPKTKSSLRDIPLNKTIRSILKSQRKQTSDFFGNRIVPIDNFVFLRTNGEALSQKTITYSMKNVCAHLRKRGYQFEDFTAHGLRVQFATDAIRHDISPQILKGLLGHTSYEMTMDQYSRVMPDMKQAGMEKLDKKTS